MSESKYYNSIDTLPINRWFVILEKSKLDELLIDGQYNEKEALNNWDSIFNEYIESFGLDDSFRKSLNLQKKIILKSCEFQLEKNENKKKFMLTQLMDLKSELNSSKIPKGKGSFHDVVSLIEKDMGFMINVENLTVRKYYTYLKILNNGKSN